MDALELLQEQHEEVKKLFKQYEKLPDHADEQRQELFEQLADKLAAHTTIEERLFYPAVKDEDTEEQLREALQEHLSAKRLIADLLELEPGDETFDAKMQVLREQVEHHVEEEEQELFKQVRELLSEEQLDDLGLRMQEEYEDLIDAEPRLHVPEETGSAPTV